MDTNKPLELEALSAVSEMLLFDKARGNSSHPTKLRQCDEKRHIVPNIDWTSATAIQTFSCNTHHLQ